MPCMKCANGKWKYGQHGNCQFDTLAACKAAAAAIHIENPKKEEDSMAKPKKPVKPVNTPAGPHQAVQHPYMSNDMPEEQPMGTPPDCVGENVHPMLEDQYK